MAHWTLDDIPWHDFDASKVTPQLLSLAKAASLVEHNGYDYARYLKQVFPDDEPFRQAADQWAIEEVQHGQALAKWAEMADPTFKFEESFHIFTTGYQLPQEVAASVRGSKSGELVARCIVEVGTSSYYTAIAEACDEPVLRAIALKIAADEFRHYKLFYDHLKRYLEAEKIGKWKRLGIALSRIAESEDDELAYAFYAAHRTDPAAVYQHRYYTDIYSKYAYRVYRKPHVDRMTGMVFKAVGLKPNGIPSRLFAHTAWAMLRYKRHKVRHAVFPALQAGEACTNRQSVIASEAWQSS